MRTWIARVLIVTLLVAAMPGQILAQVVAGPDEKTETATASDATGSDAANRDTNDDEADENTATPADAQEELATAGNAVALLSLARTAVDTDEYVLEAEDESIASYDEANLNGDGNRMELQNYGSVTFDLSKVDGFAAGDFLLLANMNGNSTRISVSVNGTKKGEFAKENLGWGSDDLEEFYYHGVLTLEAENTLTIREAAGEYSHLDSVTLVRVDEEILYWIEAEDTSVTTLEGGAGIHSDGDRVELNSGAGITFHLSEVSGFESGTYTLAAGLNGAREYLELSVDGESVGSIQGPAEGKWDTGTCRDCSYYGEDLELGTDSTITLADMDGSWGHVDYIRLVRTGDLKPRFDETDAETGIRIVADDGVLPEGTTIQVKSVNGSAGKTLRRTFAENGQKAFFYRFCLLDGDGKEIDLDEASLDGEILVYLPIPDGYSADSALYYVEDAEDVPALQTGYETVNGCLRTQLTMYGIYIIADADSWQFEGEEHYSQTTNGGAAADLQPLESIDVAIPVSSGFETGVYNLFVRACGYQNYTVYLNGTEMASISRDGTDWGDFSLSLLPAALTLRSSDVITLTADDQYGWVDYILLVPAADFEEEDDGAIVTAEAGVVPAGTILSVEKAEGETLEWIMELFGVTEEDGIPMSFWNFVFLYEDQEIEPAGPVTVQMEVPDGFDSETMQLYAISASGRKTMISFAVADDGSLVEFEVDSPGLIGFVAVVDGVNDGYYYYGADYYERLTGSENQYADLQPQEEVAFCAGDAFGFADGTYILTLRSNGNRTKLMVKVNGTVVGMLSREATGYSETDDMNEAVFEQVLFLTPEDVIAIYAPGTEGYGPYGWLEYVKLTPTDEEENEETAIRSKITLQAEDYWPDELEADGQVANVNNPAKRLEIPILASCGFAEEADYLFTMYTTGTMRSYEVYVNGSLVLSGELDGSGYEMQYMVKAVGSETITLKPGDILEIMFPEQDTDNYGNWVDSIVLNSRRRAPDGSLASRNGGRVVTGTVTLRSTESPYSLDGGTLIYQGETYYPAQNDNPAADLQPGEQIRIPVADHWDFVDGTYRLSVRSCGNRESFQVKVNGTKVGSISRKESSYGMDQMSDDAMGTLLELRTGDILILEGQTGGKYGWVDTVSLTPVSRSDEKEGLKQYSWEAEDFYEKQKDNPAADLQPGEQIDIPLGSNESFSAGSYYILALSNGNRTMMRVEQNGTLIGSITRNETSFSMGGMTLDALQKPVTLTPQDTISICAPGEPGAEEGPWGWVDQLVLIEAETSAPAKKAEYRYPAAAYGTASSFLAAADLQPEESLVIPLSDQADFSEGEYRVFVISNGTREEFSVSLNGGYVGAIRRSESDYGDNGMSADMLPTTLYLKPTDVITVTGQAGDYYGWVSALLLERVD